MLKAKLESQRFRCALSGEEIMPGVNASMDHVVPVSRGGALGVENVQWVSIRVNKMKGDMLPDQFLSLCKAIVERAASHS